MKTGLLSNVVGSLTRIGVGTSGFTRTGLRLGPPRAQQAGERDGLLFLGLLHGVSATGSLCGS